MRWGGKQRKRKSYMYWSSWFAWYPVKTMTNVWVWMEQVERCSYMAPWIPAGSPFIGRYSFRSLP